MNYFWGNVFDYFKERRSAGAFYGILMALLGLAIGGFVLYQTLGPDNFRASLEYALPLVALILFLWTWRTLTRARARWRDRYKTSPLSRDELIKARSKLTRAKR